MITLAAADYLAGVAGAASVVTCSIFGMELNNGAEVYKVLDQRQLAAAAATIYTAPASTTAFIRTIMVVNNDSVARTFQLFRGGTAAANVITPPITLNPYWMAIYEDSDGWKIYNSTGQLITGYGLPLGDINYAPTSFWAESIPRSICTETNAVIPTASGTLFMQAIYLRAGKIVTNISWFSATTAAGTPTHWMFGLFDASRNLLATSTDQLTAAWAANTQKTLAMVTPYTIPSDGIYYIGMFMTATTIITSKGNTAITNGALAAVAPILHGISTTGLTTALPNPAAAITSGLVTAWCAVS
jgi:hypothetical protein